MTSSPWWPPPGRPTPASWTTWPGWPTWPRRARCGSTSTAPTAAPRCSPRRSGTFAGFERADSFIVDPHKWLFAPFDCAALIYRRPNLAKAVHTQDASYLEVLHSQDPEEWNPSDYAYHLTRRARGLPIWFSMAVNGLDAYRDAVEAGLAIARAVGPTDHRDAADRIGARARTLGGAVPPAGMGQARLRRLVGAVAVRPDGVRDAHRPGKARRWPASPSSTPAPRWT